jgi:DNA-binding NarL/FixJ family response regulator
MLADDHQTVREGLRALFATIPDVEVVAEADDVESAVQRARDSKPDLIILDLSLPKISGLTAIPRIKQEHPGTAIAVLTRYRDPAFVRQAFSAGAAAYVLKQSPFSELRRAVELAAQGERYLDARLVESVGDILSASTMEELSARERDVLRRTALGHSNKEISASLGIAVKTVEVHKTHAMRKLGLRDRSDLIRYAALHAWLREP